ncbi:calmin [Notolabrus celidotus]|uniref:calmin n=1 Tax=Notolabrus celidotus TaxID=1203425 RepID=UPI0014902C3D|nr:calmin [Notolabrus celidotus]
MAGHEWEDWFEREEFIGQISDMRVQNLQVEREVVQKRTFTRWMNLHLEKCDPPIEVQDLFRDIQDGHILMALLEELSGCKLLQGFKKSSHRIFRLNNIAKVLSFLEERNVKLVSIDASDVADGNSSIILGLIWNIILFFQIKELTGNIRSQFPSCSSLSSIPTSSDSDASYCSTPSDERQTASSAMREHSKAIKKLLQWVQKRTRKYGVAVQDFGKSWKSGLAFLAVIKAIDSSLVDMRKALLRTARENLEDAFRIAHYSLGIPRLLEPEDVTINTPDEQSIIIYVSQFLEHFPGIEEDEHSRLIERSVSMCRLNYREADSDYLRNGTHRSRVRERSYMFERDSAQPPPKILISSVSEDRSTKPPSFRVAAARSWSSEDILADTEELSKQPKELSNEASTNSTSDPPELTYPQSPSSSSVPESVNTESVIGDSAISSPDSWVESEFGVTPEKFSESRSDSSLCDSGTAWDVYRATPVEITTLDDVVPLIEGKTPDEQSITESYTDEGVYSLSSMESTQERVHDKKQEEVENEKENNPSEKETENKLDPKQTDVDQPQKQSPEPCNEKTAGTDQTNPSPLISISEPPEDLRKQTSVEESAHKEPECDKKAVDLPEGAQGQKVQANGPTESKNVRLNNEKLENECLKTDSPSGESKEESEAVKEKGERVVETQDKGSEGVSKESLKTETHDGASETSPAPGINIPVISISSEPEEHGEERRPDRVADDEVHQVETSGSKVNPQNQDKSSPESNDNHDDKEFVSSSPVLENAKHATSEQVRDKDIKPLDGADEHGISKSSNSDICAPDTKDAMDRNEDKQKPEPSNPESQTGNSEKDSIAQSAEGKPQPGKTEQEAVVADQPSGHQDKLIDLSVDGETTSEPVNSKPNEPGDRSSPTDDLLGDLIEPMDLFYPDKEEPMFTEPPDSEMESWPSVLSVSPLQPAPASETLPEDQPLILLGEDFRNGVDSIKDKDQLINLTNLEASTPPQSPDGCLLKKEGLWGGEVPADCRDLSEAENQSSDSAKENTEPVRNESESSSTQDEIQIAPVLRHRKGARLTDSSSDQSAVTAATRNTDNKEAAVWWGDGWELYLLLLLWLLLYCFWVLPQIDLKTLPSLLLNL